MMGKKGFYEPSDLLGKMEPINPPQRWLTTSEGCEKQLDPCPKCSKKGAKIIWKKMCFYVECSCGCIGPKAETRQMAYLKWNSRADWGDCVFCGREVLNGYVKGTSFEAYCPDCRASHILGEVF